MILDTNAVSAVADNQAAAVRLFSSAASIELPAIVLGEYRFGISQSRRRKQYEKWLEELIAATRVLPVDEETTGHYAQVRSELKKPVSQSRPTISGSQLSAVSTGSQ